MVTLQREEMMQCGTAWADDEGNDDMMASNKWAVGVELKGTRRVRPRSTKIRQEPGAGSGSGV
jgi:hypothetical protein